MTAEEVWLEFAKIALERGLSALHPDPEEALSRIPKGVAQLADRMLEQWQEKLPLFRSIHKPGE